MTTRSSSRDRDAEDERDENRIWERDFRRYQNERFDKLDKRDEAFSAQLTQHAQIIERVLARLDALEGKPREQRALFGLANNTIYTLVALTALGFDAFTTILALASTVIALFALLHH